MLEPLPLLLLVEMLNIPVAVSEIWVSRGDVVVCGGLFAFFFGFGVWVSELFFVGAEIVAHDDCDGGGDEEKSIGVRELEDEK